MNSISFDALGVSPALEAMRLALSSLSPVETAALALGVVFAVTVLALLRAALVADRRPMATLNDRLAAEVAREVTR